MYSGIYEPDHPSSDSDGFRTDILDLIGQMGVSCVRYPGGNFVSNYNWLDGVGPAHLRPKKVELAWRSIETNEFGLNEFMKWAKAANVQPMMTVNLGTRDIENALSLLEYCNLPGGTYYSDMRKQHGVAEPYNISLWCLGNEMDGKWQVGHRSAEEYGRVAEKTGRAMKMLDPSIQLVACGSSKSDMLTHPDWDITVLNHVYEVADYLSIHQYYGGQEKGTGAFLAQSLDFERYIDTIRSAIAVIRQRKRTAKEMYISVDEWGVWELPDTAVNDEVNKQPWQIAPKISEQIYTMQDALLFASMLMAMLRNADIVKIGCQSLLTNISACIMTEKGGGSWKQTIYYPFSLLSKYGRGTILETVYNGEYYSTEEFQAVPYLDALVVENEGNELTVFAVNRGETDCIDLRIDLQGYAELRPIDHIVLRADDPCATNEEDHNAVTPFSKSDLLLEDHSVQASLEPMSFHVFRFSTK